MKFINIIVLVLGAFEFMSSYRIYIGDIEDSRIILPTITSSFEGKCVLITMLLMLGMQRLTFVFGGKTMGSYCCLIFTHLVETIFWYALALNNSTINPAGALDAPSLLKALLAGSLEVDDTSKKCLIVLPILVIYFTMSAMHKENY